MPSVDLIEVAMSQPMDWKKFESMVCALLVEDDFPSLRRLGGYGDHGLDAVEEAFYDSERVLQTAVQITAQKAQILKVADTLAKLRKYGITPKAIIFVFKDECSAGTRREIQKQCNDAGAHADVRDRSYLVQKLGSPGSTVFARYLGGDIAGQVQTLLGKPDPLGVAPNPLKRSVLASVAAYGQQPRSKLVQGRLFQRTILAVLAANPKPLSLVSILDSARSVLPEMQLDEGQIRAALRTLQERGEVCEEDGAFSVAEDALARVGKVFLEVQTAYADLQSWVREHCEKGGKIDNATEGYIARNVRDATALLVRFSSLGESPILDKPIERQIQLLLWRDVDDGVAKRCLAALSSYVEKEETRAKLAPFLRSYRSLAIRNVDPVGRSWQAAALHRSTIALDTDAVLKILITDLPEHAALQTAVRAFAAEKVRIIASEHVIEEVVGHVERAPKTLARFRDRLLQLPLPTVDSSVWHAVVRGFAYGVHAGAKVTWEQYYARYFDPDDPAGFVRRILVSRIPTLEIEDLYTVPDKDVGDLGQLSELVLEKKEQSRLKAEFRGPEMQRERVEHDLRMLMGMSNRSRVQPHIAKGYLATEDKALFLAERAGPWGNRPKVSVMTRALPGLAEFVCGAAVEEAELVRLVFEPVVAAAAEMLDEEIEALTSAGVDLHSKTLEQIEWALEKGLRKQIHEFVDADKGADAGRAGQLALDLLEESKKAGLALTKTVDDVATNYRKLVETAAADKQQLVGLKGDLKRILYEVAGQSGKARTRANKMLRALGIDPVPAVLEEPLLPKEPGRN